MYIASFWVLDVGIYIFFADNKQYFARFAVKTNYFLIYTRIVSVTVLPVLNMDVTTLVQSLVVVSYIGLIYMLSVELIGYYPFLKIKKAIQAEKAIVEAVEVPRAEECTMSPQHETNIDEACNTSSENSIHDASDED